MGQPKTTGASIGLFRLMQKDRLSPVCSISLFSSNAAFFFKSNPQEVYRALDVEKKEGNKCSVNVLETAHGNSLLQRDSAGI
jgi:hypothetical protein